MSRDFLQSLDLDESIYSPGNLIVVHESGGRIDAGFVHQFILSDFFKRFGTSTSKLISANAVNCKAILVTVMHSQTHWAAIASRLGWNFSSCQEKGQLTVIDLLQESFYKLNFDLAQPKIPGKDVQNSSETLKQDFTQNIDLGELFLKICASLPSETNNSSNSKVQQLILIEDLSSLLYQHQEKNTMDFLCKLKSFAKKNNSSILTLVHGDLGSSGSDDKTGCRFAKLVAQVLGDVCIQVSPLSTGVSPQISGYLTIRNKIKINGSKGLKSCHYKLEDRGVKVTPL